MIYYLWIFKKVPQLVLDLPSWFLPPVMKTKTKQNKKRYWENWLIRSVTVWNSKENSIEASAWLGYDNALDTWSGQWKGSLTCQPRNLRLWYERIEFFSVCFFFNIPPYNPLRQLGNWKAYFLHRKKACVLLARCKNEKTIKLIVFHLSSNV